MNNSTKSSDFNPVVFFGLHVLLVCADYMTNTKGYLHVPPPLVRSGYP